MTQVDDERGSLDNTDFIKASEPLFFFFKLISILSNKEIIVRRKRRKI